MVTVFEVFARTRPEISRVVQIGNSQDGANIKSVKLFGEYEYKIVHDATSRYDQEIDKVDAFHSAINCHFGEWTSSKLFDVIQNLPLFYQRKFAGTAYDNTLQINYDVFSQSVDDIERKLNVYTDIIHTFNENNTDVAYYNDAAVPVAFVSLSAKIYELLRLTPTSHKNVKDKVFIQEMLEEMNAVQGFVSTNCPTKNSTSENSNFYGYATNLKIDKSTDQLLEKLGGIGLLTNPKNCSIAHMVLDEFANMIPEHEGVISNAIFIIDNDKKIPISGILAQYKQSSYDIDLLYLYQNAVINLIMKQIYLYMYSMDVTNDLFKTTKSFIGEINKKISVIDTYLPDKFVEGFKLLNALENDKEAFLKYYDSIESIQLNAQNTEFMEVQPSVEYLNEILKNIHDKFSNFVCVGRYFKILQNQYNDYYMPFANIKNKLIVTPRYSNMNLNTCNFLFFMYLNTYKIVIFTNRSIDTNQNHSEQAQYLDNTTMAMAYVKNHFIMVNKHLTDDVGLLKIARNIITILENQNRPTSDVQLLHIKRMVNYVMSELNEYGIKNCTLPDFNYLMFNNTNFIQLKNNSVKHLFNDKVAYSSESVIDFSSITNLDSECFNYKHIYETYVKPIGEVENIEITFYWEGKKLNIHKIFEEATSLFSNPRHLYEFYDIYFKHLLATIYLELKMKYSALKSGTPIASDEKCDKNEVKLRMENNFPLELRSLSDEISSFWINFLDLNNDDTLYNQKFDKIEKQFNQYNTIFNSNPSSSKPKKKSKPSKFSKIVALLENTKKALSCLFNITKKNE